MVLKVLLLAFYLMRLSKPRKLVSLDLDMTTLGLVSSYINMS